MTGKDIVAIVQLTKDEVTMEAVAAKATAAGYDMVAFRKLTLMDILQTLTVEDIINIREALADE